MNLLFTGGKKEELVGRLEKKIAKTKDELSDVIDNIQSKLINLQVQKE